VHRPVTTIAALVEDQVSRTPDRTALIWHDEHLSYAGLNARANRLARVFLSMGAAPEATVAVECCRCADMIAAMLAVWKTGAACVPLDMTYPLARRQAMVDEARPVCVATRSIQVPRCVKGWPMVVIDAAAPSPQLGPPLGAQHGPQLAAQVAAQLGTQTSRNVEDAERHRPLHPQHPAYVIYTSGSSGVPRGVVGLHEGMVNRLRWFSEQWSLGERGAILAKTSFAFIDGLTEWLAALISGATVVGADDDESRDIAKMGALVGRHAIGVLTLVPSVLRIALEEWPAAERAMVKLWVSSGEALGTALVASFRTRCPDAELVDLYGMSEASGDSLWSSTGHAGIGMMTPVWNTQVYLLDDHLQPVPAGVCGELYVGGRGLARGYVGAHALSAARFVPNPYGAEGSRLYRTGDLARCSSEGALEFLGRADQQIKLRGVRIELGEIETALLQMPGAQAAIVIGEGNGNGKTQSLIAFVVMTTSELDGTALRRMLRRKLPALYVPARIELLPALPFLPNGKVDRAALHRNVPAPRRRTQASSIEERLLCGVFEELFRRRDIHRDSDFFELGGDSLEITRLVNRVRRSLDVELSADDVLEHSTLHDLASRISEIRHGRCRA
jgi:amino acid adenylation domain-containing protein